MKILRKKRFQRLTFEIAEQGWTVDRADTTRELQSLGADVIASV